MTKVLSRFGGKVASVVLPTRQAQADPRCWVEEQCRGCETGIGMRKWTRSCCSNGVGCGPWQRGKYCFFNSCQF